MRAQKGLFKGLNPTVTVASKLLVISFVLLCVILAEQAGAFFQHTSDAILSHFKWFYLSLVTGVLGLLVYLMLSRFGHIRLGADDEKPEFGFTSWIAMLFSGGMGIGLIFWSVAEPIWHYSSNPFTADMSDESATMAMRLTLFHWGLHPWAIFTIVGLSLAYFAYRKGLPLSMRSILYPFIGDRIYGPIGHVTDILAVAITAFGVSQSLGLGVTQINTGFNQVFGLPVNFGVQAILIGLISLCAILSVMSGVSRGIRRLSEWNMVLSILLLVVVLAIGPTRYLLNLMLESSGDYLQNLVGLSLWTDAQKDSGWQNWWTAFYWPWWMTWGPFVGLFIARVSRGRTIRELIAGTLLVPTMVTIVWMSVLGGSALKAEQEDRQAHQQQVEQGVLTGEAATFTGGDILTATKKETTSAMFTLLSKIDAGLIGQGLSILVCLLLATYFVTSADSGTLVLCTLCAEGHPEPPQGIRVLWGVLQALIAMALLYAGGLKTIQMASIAAGLPIAVFILIMSVALMRCVRQEGFTGLPRPLATAPAPQPQAHQREDKAAAIALNLGGANPAVVHAQKAS